MNLLPKSSTEFSSAQYWETFFKKRGTKNFEWYGEYPELCGILHKYMRPKDRTLVIGCGNSRLSEDLYDVGYRELVNIDIVESVIKQMVMRNAKQRPSLKFEQMDVLQMTYEDSSFSVVLDKGTLDALLPDSKESSLARVDRMFGEIGRVLKVGGRYVCITLAQEHIIKKLLDYFPSEGWMVRVHKVAMDKEKQDASDTGSPMPVFIIICTKFKKMGAGHKPILELSLVEGQNPDRVSSTEDLMRAVKGQQDFAMVQHNLQKWSFCDEPVSLDLYGTDNTPRYTLHVVDKPKGKTAANHFAIFIVPQGRETEFLFGTDRGRGQLADQVGFQRLVVAALHRGHRFESLDTVKAELSPRVMELSPASLPPNTQVPFLTVGQDAVGEREVRYQEKGSLGNDIIVEDVRGEDGGMYRQIIFSSNPRMVQSHARLITANNKARSKSGKKRGRGGAGTAGGGGGGQAGPPRVDHLYLSMDFHRAMVGGVAALPGCVELLKKGAKLLLVGLGGGGLPMFLYKQFPKMELDVVELDPALKEVASSFFGLVEDRRFRVHIQDGLDFVRAEASKEPASQYNIVMFDVDSKDISQGLGCPPKAFLEADILDSVKKLLDPTQGIFILNFACRDNVLKEEVIADICTRFPTIYRIPMEDHVNEILLCLPERTTCTPAKQQRGLLMESGRALQQYCKSVTSRWESDFDLSELMEEMKMDEDR